ncbi:MAG: copper homeostasis protein CutC [Gemmatimonadaceae bacterium]|nr:copper homeostasis protein CutC [Gemmatimonadaceae bacterium]
MPVLVEACVDSVADAVTAERLGAGRIELCANLQEGGTTPSLGMVRATVAKAGIPIFPIIRPRGGDFCYSADEIEVMLRDIEAAKAAGVHGIVGGALHPNGTIDEDGTEALLEAAAPLPFTFHRAFDLTRDLDEALDACLALGVTRILTSGGASTALEGVDALGRLRTRAGARLGIIAGGTVRGDTASQVVERAGVLEVHTGPRRAATGAMRARHGSARIGTRNDDGRGWQELDADALAAVVQALARSHA